MKIPVVLTIGNFDGVHLGHRALLKRIADEAASEKHHSVALTFSNHPSQILRPSNPTPCLCSTPHKLKLIENAGIDHCILLPFTKEFSEQTAEQFLHRLQESVPFRALVLGSDAHFGKNREGTPETVTALSKKMGFTVEYFADVLLGDSRVSSSNIRSLISQGNLEAAARWLGRPFSIYERVQKGRGHGGPMGFPTLNLSVDSLCLPPYGVYAVNVLHKGKQYRGVANLGFAPTVHEGRACLLEVHLLDAAKDLYNEEVEVVFVKFLRPEKRFDSVALLQQQIAQDVQEAKTIDFFRNCIPVPLPVPVPVPALS